MVAALEQETGKRDRGPERRRRACRWIIAHLSLNSGSRRATLLYSQIRGGRLSSGASFDESSRGVKMFAIVKVGGKQYRVEEGGRFVVDRLDAAPG